MALRKQVIFCFLLLAVYLTGQSQNFDTLVDVGNYKLHLSVLQGKGIPILFEAGAGNDGSIWKQLLKPLHDSLGAPLITYDREGFGKSEIDTTDLNIVTEAKGLEIALRKLGFDEKFFLVAHSLGGNYAMVFCNRNPNKVVGGVFIDIVSPQFMTRNKALEIKNTFEDSLDVIKKESLGFYYIIKNYEYTNMVMREVAPSIKIPLTIICADKPPFDGSEGVRWKQCMKKFASESSNRRYLIAKNSGHYIFIDNSKLVIREIIKRYKQ
ncbi:MAG TPA: alpha/beta hydrolase [Cytophagaceae bacterium]